MDLHLLEKHLIQYTYTKGFNPVTFKYLCSELGLKDLEKGLKVLSKCSKYSHKQISDELENNSISYSSYLDSTYPVNLKEIADSPSVIYYRGNIDLLKKPKVALSGSRKPTYLGRKLTTELVNYLSEEDISLVIGGAIGLDTIAINEFGKRSTSIIVVLPSALSDFYPSSNSNLFNKIIENGGLVLAEMLFKDILHKGRFLQRNRIISALSDVLVILQASIKSGTLSCAKYGIEYNKQVYTYLDNKYSEEFMGNNILVKRNYAEPLLNNDEILDHLKIQKLLL